MKTIWTQQTQTNHNLRSQFFVVWIILLDFLNNVKKDVWEVRVFGAFNFLGKLREL